MNRVGTVLALAALLFLAVGTHVVHPVYHSRADAGVCRQSAAWLSEWPVLPPGRAGLRAGDGDPTPASAVAHGTHTCPICLLLATCKPDLAVPAALPAGPGILRRAMAPPTHAFPRRPAGWYAGPRAPPATPSV